MSKLNPDTVEEFRLVNPSPRSPQEDLDEYFPTPAWAIRALLDRLPIPRDETALEPCCGTGEILRELIRAGLDAQGLELRAERASACPDGRVGQADFLRVDPLIQGWLFGAGWHYIITNPPWSLTVQFHQQAMELVAIGGIVALLIPLEYLGGLERYQKLFAPGSGFSQLITLARRPWPHAKACGWFVWEKGFTGPWKGSHHI